MPFLWKLLDVQLLQDATPVFRADFVLASFSRFLMRIATLRIG
jgi:hypothetical protein